MAALPVGAAYRDEVMSPMGVPPVAPVGRTAQLAGGGAIATPISKRNMPPSLYAADSTDPTPASDVPAMTSAVSPMVGPMVADVRGNGTGGPPTITVPDLVPVKARPATPTSVSYTIVAGDNLAKIAKKFYGSSKKFGRSADCVGQFRHAAAQGCRFDAGGGEEVDDTRCDFPQAPTQTALKSPAGGG